MVLSVIPRRQFIRPCFLHRNFKQARPLQTVELGFKRTFNLIVIKKKCILNKKHKASSIQYYCPYDPKQPKAAHSFISLHIMCMNLKRSLEIRVIITFNVNSLQTTNF